MKSVVDMRRVVVAIGLVFLCGVSSAQSVNGADKPALELAMTALSSLGNEPACAEGRRALMDQVKRLRERTSQGAALTERMDRVQVSNTIATVKGWGCTIRN